MHGYVEFVTVLIKAGANVDVAGDMDLSPLHYAVCKALNSIPDTIGELVNMVTIRLNDNEIGGTIPTNIGSMSALRVILLSGNSMGGPIPSEIGLLTDLWRFDIGEQHFSGTIPTEMGQLSNLCTSSGFLCIITYSYLCF